MLLNHLEDSVPSSFFSAHRRSRQALFQASSTDGTAFISPKTARIAIDGSASAPVSSSLNSSLLSTPEAVRSLSGSFTLTTPSPRSSHEIVQKLRQRGSLTDPARPRRRHISGPILVLISHTFSWLYSNLLYYHREKLCLISTRMKLCLALTRTSLVHLCN